MNDLSSQPGRHLIDGSIRVLLAEALFPLTALITTAFLTRRLGPAGYGLLVLTATLVAWIEWTINSLFSRATITFVGQANDWRPIGSNLVRLHLAISVAAMVAVWFLAVPIAGLLDEPLLAPYLCLFAIDLPLFSLVHSHRSILIGIGAFGQGALASAWRSLTRLGFVLALVEGGLSVPGAIVAGLGASLVELVVIRRSIRPALFGRVSLSMRPLWHFAAPLFLSSLSLSCYSRLDLFVIKALGGTAIQAGFYGAAQNLSLLPGIFAISFSPLLLSTLSRMLHVGEAALARELGRNAMRLVMGLLPMGAIIAGSAPEIVGFLFGPRFTPVAPLLAVLIFGSVSLVIVSVATAILTAAGKPRRILALTGLLVPAALVGHLLVIPRFGATGAAAVTTILAGVCAIAAVLAVYRLWEIVPPAGTLIRTAFAGALAYGLAVAWAVPGFWLLLKLPVIGIAVAFAYLILGEFKAEEIAFARSLVGWRTMPAQSRETY